MIDMDNEVEEKRRLDRARVLVRTPWRPTIQHTIDVFIGGEIFKVHVVEESGGGYRECSGKARSMGGSSEEIASDDSHLECISPTSMEKMLSEDRMRNSPERMTEKSMFADQRTIDLSRSLDNHKNPLGNGENLRFSGGRQQFRHHGQTRDQAATATVTYDRDHTATQGQERVISFLDDVAVSKQIHENGKLEKGETSNLEDLCGPEETCDEPQQGDNWWPRDNAQSQGGFELAHEDTIREQSSGDNNGLTKELGLSTYTPSEITSRLGLSPVCNKNGSENRWQVYSRQRKGKKNSQMGCYVSTARLESYENNIQTPPIQNMLQQETLHIAGPTQGMVTPDHNGEIKANPKSEFLQEQEAEHIWTKAKQLGVSGVEEQEMIIEKIKIMEERDKSEAERRGDRTRTQ